MQMMKSLVSPAFYTPLLGHTHSFRYSYHFLSSFNHFAFLCNYTHFPASLNSCCSAAMFRPKKTGTGDSASKKAIKKPGQSDEAWRQEEDNRLKKFNSYSVYIFRVLKQVHPDTGISGKAMSIMNSFVNDVFGRIVAEASSLVHCSKRSTISSREIPGKSN
ncbi:hypothetical protein WR25_12427 [Diploscapter pachys]|uniref:Core Histone H2A/H2B/H3 domain-containing protein n=1 Tax=Diploscapter pachys TaxID=2018661 RepID=A0A2A2LMI2_9BILA|nr:hypothetical protein WR25_12427 [Diploscapter pachys]